MMAWRLGYRLSRKLRYFAIFFLLVLCIYILLLFTLIHEERARSVKERQNATTTSQLSSNSTRHYMNMLIDRLLQDLQYDNSGGVRTTGAEHWRLAESWTNSRHIHADRVPQLGMVLHHMAHSRVKHADIGFKGTQLKLTLLLEGKQVVVFKPRWYERDEIIAGGPYAGKDRHNGEIAAYQLGRLLQFNRSPLVVGRTVNLRKEILPVASKKLRDTFFNQNGTTCFYGKCYYCSRSDPVCADDHDDLEGVIILWLPKPYVPQRVASPWIRNYKTNKTAGWEVDDTFCERVVVKRPVYRDASSPRLLDLIDTAVFDFLIGNADRHHYEVFKDLHNSTVLLIDNGKSFGNGHHDETSILAPLYQCCRIRRPTYERLKLFAPPVSLSASLDRLLKTDPLWPILSRTHLSAIDRRLLIVLDKVSQCITRRGEGSVLVDDGFD